MRKSSVLLIMLLGLAACIGGGNGSLEQPAEHRLLFIGNSFTGNNELDQLVSNLLNEAGNGRQDNFTTRSTTGGYKFIDHIQDIEDESREAALRQLLVTGSETARDWDWVVLQEQSQVLGFAPHNGERVASFSAASRLNQVANQTAATVMVMSTWGYVFGDEGNSTIFPDYLTMQRSLVIGAKELAATLSSQERAVYVIPAGWGFQLVYQDLNNAGLDPLAEGSRFRALYANDDKHPSLSGSYLAACIATAVYIGQPVTNISWKPRGIDQDVATYLRSVADRVVFGDEYPPQNYPWN